MVNTASHKLVLVHMHTAAAVCGCLNRMLFGHFVLARYPVPSLMCSVQSSLAILSQKLLQLSNFWVASREACNNTGLSHSRCHDWQLTMPQEKLAPLLPRSSTSENDAFFITTHVQLNSRTQLAC